MSKKLFITGGMGYIGSLLAKRALEAGHSVVIYDSLIYEQDHARLLHDIAGGRSDAPLTFVVGDTRNKELLDRTVRETKPDFMVHFGELVGPYACEHNPKLTEDVNWNGSRNAVDICVALGIPLIYNSSSSVYGNQKGEQLLKEDHPLPPVPADNYCKYKLMMEEYVKEKMVANPNFKAIMFRPATVGGVAPRIRIELLPNHFTYCAVAKGVIKISEPDSYRSVIDVEDMVRAYLKVIERGTWKQAVYNIALTNLSKMEYTTRIQALVPCEIVAAPGIGDTRNLQIDSSAFEEEFDYKPATSYEAMIQRVADWIRAEQATFEANNFAGILNISLDRWNKMI